jgi:hypothetical protein
VSVQCRPVEQWSCAPRRLSQQEQIRRLSELPTVPAPGRITTVEEIAMDTFDPRYQLEAEEPVGARMRSPLAHAEIQQTLHALDHLAWRLRGRMRARRRRL